MDGYYRGGEMQDHKAKADEALEGGPHEEGQEVDKVLVWRRRDGGVRLDDSMADGRDFLSTDCSASMASDRRAGVHARRGPLS